MPKKRIAVLMGGPSLEHDVSVSSGTEIINHLKHEKYWIHPILVDRDNNWYWSKSEISNYMRTGFNRNYFFGNEFLIRQEKQPALSELPKVEVVLNAMHGSFGEDGRVQAILDYYGFKYTGSGLAGCALSMDKIKTKEVYVAHGIPTAPWKELRRDEDWNQVFLEAKAEWGFPLPIKDPVGGSSLGMGIAHDDEEALQLIEKLFADAPVLLIEKFIPGRETSCGVVEGMDPMPVTEIITEKGYFDFEAKYEGKSQEITPADFPPEVTEQMQQYSLLAHKHLLLKQYSRTDYRIDDQGNIWALETNALPGMTSTSLIPQQMAHLGVNYSDFLDHLIEGVS